MVCINCGCKLPDGVTVCRVCGGTEAAESLPTPQMSPAFSKAPDLEFTPRSPKNPCPRCGKRLPKDAKICSGCGKSVQLTPCPYCGGLQPEDATFCGDCHRMLRTEPSRIVDPVPPIDMPAPEPVIEIPVLTKTCPGCGQVLPIEAKFCNGCGRSMEEKPVAAPVEPTIVIPSNTKICPDCGQTLSLEAKFCNGCGRSMEEKPAAVPVEPIVPEPTIVIPSTTRICPGCGCELPLEAKFCNSCGARTDGTPAEPTVSTKLCPNCGKELPMEAKFCNGCGCDLVASAITNSAAVTVTDPVVITTAEKKAKSKKAKKAKSGKSGKWIVITLVAIALAIVVGLGVWIALEDPFDWFDRNDSSQQEEDQEEKAESPEDVAVAHIKAMESGDAEKYCSYYHDSVLKKRMEDSGYSDRDAYIAYLKGSMDDRRSDMEEDLGGEYSYTVKAADTDTFTGEDLEILQASFANVYDLTIDGYKVVLVETTYTTADETEKTVEYECPMIKVDGKWYLGG